MSDLELCNLAYNGCIDELITLLERNPKLTDQRDSNRRTALHWACSSGQKEVIASLLEKGAEVTLVFVFKLNKLATYGIYSG